MTLASPRRSSFHAIALLAIAGLAINFSTRGALALEPATPLGGPTVDTKVAPGSNGTFGSGKASVKARGEREIPHRDFMRAVQEALAAGAPEGVVASPDLEQKLRDISSEFATAQRTYAQKNRESIGQLRQLDRPSKKDAKKGPPDAKGDQDMKGEAPAMSEQDQAAMLERLREVRENAPKAADAHTKIWALLSEPQQAAVQTKLDVIHKEAQGRENQRYVQRRAATKAGEGANATPATTAPGKPKAKNTAVSEETVQPAAPASPAKADAPRADRPAATKAAPIAPQHRERLMRVFERMTHEQREELLRRVEERMGAGAGEGTAGAQRARPAARGNSDTKPAPDMKTVDVPMSRPDAKDKPE